MEKDGEGEAGSTKILCVTTGLTLRILLKHVDFWALMRVAMFAVHAWRLAVHVTFFNMARPFGPSLT